MMDFLSNSKLSVLILSIVLLSAAAVGAATVPSSEPVGASDNQTTTTDEYLYTEQFARTDDGQVVGTKTVLYSPDGTEVWSGDETGLNLGLTNKSSDTTYYNATSDGSIEVYDTTNQDNRTLEKVINPDYEPETITDAYVEEATDEAVIVGVNTSTDAKYLHIIDRATGNSILRTEASYETPNRFSVEAVTLPNQTVFIDNSKPNGDYEFIRFNASTGTVEEHYTYTNSDQIPFFTDGIIDGCGSLEGCEYPTEKTGTISIGITTSDLNSTTPVDVRVYEDRSLIWERTNVSLDWYQDAERDGEPVAISYYRINSTVGNYTVEVDADSYTPKNKSYNITENLTTSKEYDFYEPEGTAAVSVESSSGNSVDNTTFSLYNSSSDNPLWVQSASQPYPVNFSLEAGEYTLRANTSGYTAQTKTFNISGGETEVVSFTLQAESDGTNDSDDGIDAIVGGDVNSSPSMAVIIGIAGIGFLIFLIAVTAVYTAYKTRTQF